MYSQDYAFVGVLSYPKISFQVFGGGYLSPPSTVMSFPEQTKFIITRQNNDMNKKKTSAKRIDENVNKETDKEITDLSGKTEVFESLDMKTFIQKQKLTNDVLSKIIEKFNQDKKKG